MEVCRKILLSRTGRQIIQCRSSGVPITKATVAARSARSMSTVLAEEHEEFSLPPPKIKDVYKSSENTLCVTFSDNSKCQFSSTLGEYHRISVSQNNLRDSCRCQACVHPPTQEKQLNSAQIDPKIQPLSWDVENNAQLLEVFWPQSARRPPHASTYSAEWLHQFSQLFQPKEREAEPSPIKVAATPAASAAEPMALPQPHDDIKDEAYTNKKSSVILWNRDEIEENPPEVEYEDFMGTRAGLKKMLKNVCKYGISVLKGVPLHELEVISVARRMGYIRETGYGLTFDVRYNADPKTHLSYTGEAGGKSFFVDGFYAAQWLRYNYPEHFKILSTTPVIFSFLDAERDRWFRESWPVISVDYMGKLKDIHFSPFSMRPPLLPPQDKVAAYYEALRLFAQRIEQSTLQYSFYLSPGDLVVLNNRRILHGRTSYDPTKVDRHLKGCYMDLDELKSLYEKMRKDDTL
ncbi:hypothetical protein MRX96_015378 [Rhipicephalus microplus]